MATPRQMRGTFRPVFPRERYCIAEKAESVVVVGSAFRTVGQAARRPRFGALISGIEGTNAMCKRSVGTRQPGRLPYTGQSDADRNSATIASQPARSSSSKRPGRGLSRSSTPSTRPSGRRSSARPAPSATRRRRRCARGTRARPARPTNGVAPPRRRRPHVPARSARRPVYPGRGRGRVPRHATNKTLPSSGRARCGRSGRRCWRGWLANRVRR